MDAEVKQASLETLIVVAQELVAGMGPRARWLLTDEIEALESEIQALTKPPTATEVGLGAVAEASDGR